VTEIGGQIGWLASGMNFKFLKPVYFGDTVKCAFTIAEIDNEGKARAEAAFTNEDETIVLLAVVTGFIPEAEEKQVMKAMVAEGDLTNKVS
jgi:acyl dehydratase